MIEACNDKRESEMKGRVLFHAAAAIIAGICLCLPSCSREDRPIRIGFSGGLTGRYSDLGTEGRNGAMLAIEEANQAGGIGGKRIELVVRDDAQDPETAQRVDRELLSEGVKAIIGHMTSAMSLAALPIVNENRVLMIRPTSSSVELSGKDDYFIMVVGTSIETPRRLAEYASRKADSVSAIYDIENKSYSEDYVEHFMRRFTEMGGRPGVLLPFSKEDKASFHLLAEKLMESRSRGILLVASAMDSAALCQQIRKLSKDVVLFSSGWAMAQEFIRNAGRAAEGVVFAEFFASGSLKKEFLDFKRRYEKRFGAEPGFAAAYGYDAATVLIEALRKDPNHANLKDTILKMRSFSGAQGAFEINQYGDAVRPQALTQVRSGGFVPTE